MTKAARLRRLETPEPCIYCGGRSRGRATGRVYKTKLGAAHFRCIVNSKRTLPHVDGRLARGLYETSRSR